MGPRGSDIGHHLSELHSFGFGLDIMGLRYDSMRPASAADFISKSAETGRMGLTRDRGVGDDTLTASRDCLGCL